MGVQDAEQFAEHRDRRPSVYARCEGIGGRRTPEECRWRTDLLHTQLPPRVKGQAATQSAPMSTASGSIVKHGGGVADAWADPVLRSRPGEDLLLCKESEDAELQSGDRYCR